MFFRDELQALAKDHELMEEDVQNLQKNLDGERKNKNKLERVLADCSDALKIALRVSFHWSCRGGTKKAMGSVT